jgi:hypothetical protein
MSDPYVPSPTLDNWELPLVPSSFRLPKLEV